MTQSTQKQNRSFSDSIGSGMKSLMGGNGRRYYILEHKVSSKYHKVGESQKIIVDQIELGRDPKCQIRFDENFGTVSRRHAAIVKDGDNWKLVQLSQTNSTYLNSHKIDKEWYLQSGDEIQLSTNGPKMGFIVPDGDKGLVKSIGLSQRLSLFRQQALRPYRQAITVLACVFVLCLAGGIWKINTLEQRLKQKTQQLAAFIAQNATNQQVADSLARELVAINQQMDDYETRIREMAHETESVKQQARQALDSIVKVVNQLKLEDAPSALKEQCFPYTYAIYQVKEVVRYPNGQVETDDNARFVGSGFLLSDGRFVSARHVTETYYYYHFNWGNEQVNAMLRFQNAIVHNGGDLETTFVAISSTGDKIQFTNKQCKVDRSGDIVGTATLENGMIVALKKADAATSDWISINTGKSGLPFDPTLSAQLPIETKLRILGFPHGRGAEDPNNVSPIYSSAEVACNGLDVNGTIMTSNSDSEPGNSGGPLFVLKDGKYCVVGVLSGNTYAKGRVVPIKVVR